MENRYARMPGEDRIESVEIRTTVDKVVAAGHLLADPRKCRIWHECWLHDGLTVQEIADAAAIPQSTTYDLTREMIAEGSLYDTGTSSTNATILKPTPMQFFVSNHPEGIGPQYNVHSTLIGVIGRGTDTDDVTTFLDRANYTLLTEAITGVLAILSGDQTDSPALEDCLGWMGPIEARLIECHIAAVLKREAEKPNIDWEFPANPTIQPADKSIPDQ